MRKLAVITLALTLGCASHLHAQTDNLAMAKAAVQKCVEFVHQFSPAEPWMTPYFRQFDAYYDAATGTVNNNGWRNGDIQPLYEFNKCMATKGFPLGSKPQ